MRSKKGLTFKTFRQGCVTTKPKAKPNSCELRVAFGCPQPLVLRLTTTDRRLRIPSHLINNVQERTPKRHYGDKPNLPSFRRNRAFKACHDAVSTREPPEIEVPTADRHNLLIPIAPVQRKNERFVKKMCIILKICFSKLLSRFLHHSVHRFEVFRTSNENYVARPAFPCRHSSSCTRKGVDRDADGTLARLPRPNPHRQE